MEDGQGCRMADVFCFVRNNCLVGSREADGLTRTGKCCRIERHDTGFEPRL